MLVLAAVWWAWGGYAWLTNALHSDDGIARVGLLAAMAAMLIAALAVPQAFGDDSVVFGFAYFAVRAIHIVVYTYGVEDTDIRGAIRGLAPGLLAAPALIVVAGFLDGGAAAGLWIVALIIDYGTPYVRDMSGFNVSPAHFHERFGLIVIIALGESIVATGTGLDATGLTAGVVAAAIAGLVIAGVPVVGLLRRRRPGRRPALRGARTGSSAAAGQPRLLRGPAPAADRRRRARRPGAEEGAARTSTRRSRRCPPWPSAAARRCIWSATWPSACATSARQPPAAVHAP